MHILIAGSLTRDVNETAGRRIETLGGAVIHGAATCVALGVDTSVAFCSAAEDLDRAREFLGQRVTVHHQDSNVTTGFENAYAKDGKRKQKIVALAPMIEVGCFDKEIDVVHLSPLHHADLAQDWLAKDTTIGLDLQGLLRPSRPGEVEYRCLPEIDTYLARADFIKASAGEMTYLLNHLGMDEDRFAARYAESEIIISDGSGGGRIITGAGERSRWTAEALAAHVDTTGAGDSFFAAFLILRQTLSAAESAASAARLTTRLLRDRAARA